MKETIGAVQPRKLDARIVYRSSEKMEGVVGHVASEEELTSTASRARDFRLLATMLTFRKLEQREEKFPGNS